MARNYRIPLIDRTMAKVDKDPISGCWNWTARTGRTGCPMIWTDGKQDRSAARVIYEEKVGRIPKGCRLWHKCGNRSCVNPDHMVPLKPFESMVRSGKSPAVKNAQKTHCPKGHPYKGDNLVWDKTGRNRLCRACRNERARIAMRKKFGWKARIPEPEPQEIRKLSKKKLVEATVL